MPGLTKIRQFREALGLTQSEMGEALGQHQRVYAYYDLGTRPTPNKVRLALKDLGVSMDWYEDDRGDMLNPGIRLEVVRVQGQPIKLESIKAGPTEKAGIRHVVTLSGGGWDPNPPTEGFGLVEEPTPVVTLPGICIAPDTVETSVRILGEALAQRGLHMPADRFATLCRMAAEMVTLEKRAGLSGTLQELVTRRTNEILEMVVKGVA